MSKSKTFLYTPSLPLERLAKLPTLILASPSQPSQHLGRTYTYSYLNSLPVH